MKNSIFPKPKAIIMAQTKSSTTKTSTNAAIANQLIIAQLFCILYLAVSFVPLFGAVDYDAVQWLYFSILNIAYLVFLWKHRDFFQPFSLPQKPKIYLAFLVGFFTMGCLSIITAINVSESLVHLSRFVNVIITFYSLYLFVRKSPKLFFYLLCKVSLFVILYQSWYALDYFIGNSHIARSAEFVSNFRHPFSSINIYTAFIVIQIPLAIYGLVYFSKIWKYISGISLFSGSLALFLAGSRTAIVSLTIIYGVSILFAIYGIVKRSAYQKTIKETIILVAIPLTVLLLGININKIDKKSMNSISTVLNPKNIDFYDGRNVLSTLSDHQKPTDVHIELPSRISSGRFSLWQLAYTNFKKNPLLGVGYGNFKALEKKEHYANYTHNKGTFANPRRAHNDFVEKLAETGIVGFLLYITLFIVPFIWFVKLMRRDGDYQKQFLYLCIFLVATAYTIDALLNFPLERPPIQLFFILAVIFILTFSTKDSNEQSTSIPQKTHFIIYGIALLMTSASIASNYLVLKSYQLQRELRTDLSGKTLFSDEPLKNNYANIQKRWINYPQLSHVGTANKVYLANYAIKAKKYDEALQILNEIKSYNGDAHLVKAFKAEIFLNVKDDLDSAKYYAEEVFDEYPAFKANYTILKNIYRAQKDTVNLWRVMNRYTTKNYRDVNGWIAKATMVYEFTKDTLRMQKILDTGLAYNSYSKKILDTKKDISKRLSFKSYLSKKEVKAKHQEAYDFFVKQQYEQARHIFEEILETNPKDYLSIQNIGIIDLIQKNYAEAIKKLSIVINASAFSDGKAEYSRGYCYEQLGQIEKAKVDYRKSRAKKYPQAMALPESKLE